MSNQMAGKRSAPDMGSQKSAAEIEEFMQEEKVRTLEDDIARLRRRVTDLEDFLRGAAVQFRAMSS